MNYGTKAKSKKVLKDFPKKDRWLLPGLEKNWHKYIAAEGDYFADDETN